MNFKEAIRFLKAHQPMPDDKALSDEDIKQYDQVRKYFLNHPDPACIPLFLNSFGNGSGYGIYQLIEDTLLMYSDNEVVPHLIAALQSQHKGVRYWSSQIAASFADKKLIEPLSTLLFEQDPDIRYSAITALSQIDDRKIYGILKSALKREDDTEVIELIEDVLSEKES
ncbi:HEAT repeat domain-containing protein [Bacillus sp. V3-13]|uniref:HEAT repeat domain-containing protein n=1 Tax=Bacillus sp. V3-13 TaxID=2053728 RepID=UPI000C7745DE|nr:HEAT repeat domain-containing protein [Bacillus sp. V3-13]PLR77520.1 HEAT repeat domain-containing protein [Bacillus sp. V3-13]